jgi:hypothetical protein
MSAPAAPAIVPVLAGQRCIAHVLRRGREGYEAFDVADISVGVVKSQAEAADALLTAINSRRAEQ